MLGVGSLTPSYVHPLYSLLYLEGSPAGTVENVESCMILSVLQYETCWSFWSCGAHILYLDDTIILSTPSYIYTDTCRHVCMQLYMYTHICLGAMLLPLASRSSTAARPSFWVSRRKTCFRMPRRAARTRVFYKVQNGVKGLKKVRMKYLSWARECGIWDPSLVFVFLLSVMADFRSNLSNLNPINPRSHTSEIRTTAHLGVQRRTGFDVVAQGPRALALPAGLNSAG